MALASLLGSVTPRRQVGRGMNARESFLVFIPLPFHSSADSGFKRVDAKGFISSNRSDAMGKSKPSAVGAKSL